MLKNLSIKVIPLITAGLLLILLATPVFAAEAHLHFFSVDPTTIDPPDPMPNQELDPLYNGADPDPWYDMCVLLMKGDWDTPFNLWIGNQDKTDTIYDVHLVISLNEVAAGAITGITFTPGGSVAIGDLDPDKADFPLPVHGIANSDEWAGFFDVEVGDIAPETALPIQIDIALGTDLTGAKLHIDAYGYDTDGDTGDYDFNNPFSHDFTFIIPEAATILAVTSSLIALATYAYIRKKQ